MHDKEPAGRLAAARAAAARAEEVWHEAQRQEADAYANLHQVTVEQRRATPEELLDMADRCDEAAHRADDTRRWVEWTKQTHDAAAAEVARLEAEVARLDAEARGPATR